MKRFRRLSIVVAALVSGSVSYVAIGAQSLPTSYSPPEDIVERWGQVLVVGLILVAIGLTIFTLVTRRGRLTDLHSKWLMFLGMGVLPVPAILLSTAVGLEQSKAVSFCNSCHAMDPFVDDMRNADSNLLAAVHFKNRYIQKNHCYACHTDYGVFGTMEAKLAGLGHVIKDARGQWERPIEISHPYRYRICLNCHAGALGFESQEAHDGVIEMVVAGEAACGDCHESAHPSRAERVEMGGGS